MPSIDTLIAAIRTNIDQTRQLIAGLGATHEEATELSNRLGTLGVEGSAAQVAVVADKIEEGQAQANALVERLEAALAALEAARTGAGGGAGGSGSTGPPPNPPPVTPAPRGAPGYPHHQPHPMSWSDLIHITHGDENNMQRGGHLAGTGRPGKTEFPPDWDVEDVRDALTEVATHPETTKLHNSGKWRAEGVYRGVRMCVMVRQDGSIEAGWPESGPGVRTNPRARS